MERSLVPSAVRTPCRKNAKSSAGVRSVRIASSIIAASSNDMPDKNDSTSWGGVADWYDRLLGGEDTFQKNVIGPHLERLMALRAGDRVLDVACGPGFFTAAFAAAGA